MNGVKRMKNNKGFSLIELIVVIAILAVLGLGVGTMFSTGTNLFSTITVNESVSSDMQITMAQIENAAVDCTDAYISGGNLYLGDSREHEYYLFSLNSDALTLKKYAKDPADPENTVIETGTVCAHVAGFEPLLTTDETSGAGMLSVTLRIRSSSETQLTALRVADIHTDLDSFTSAVFEEGTIHE